MTADPMLKPELKPVSWLKPYAKNAKLHPPDQVRRLANTIRAHGWDQPIVAWIDGTIIKGHGRRLAAIELGMEKVPVVVRSDLTEAQADQARIADNASASLQYDTGALQEELRRLMEIEPGLDLDDLALTDKEKKLLASDLTIPEDEAILQDVAGEVDRQNEADREAVAKADNEMVPISKALGFAKIRRGDERTLTAFVAEAEAATGKTGYEAFVEALRLAVQRGLV